MKRVGSRLLGFACILALAACGGGGTGGGGGDSISGTVTAPDGVTITDTVVFACYQGSCNNLQSKQFTISASGQSAPYVFSGLEVGQRYAVVAIKDANNNGQIDGSDHTGEAEALVVVPARNVNVVLEQGSSSISGAVVYPGSVSPFAVAGQGSGLERLRLPENPIVRFQKRNDLNADRPLELVPGEVLVKFEEGISVQGLRSLRVGGTELSAVRALKLGPAELQLYRANGLGKAATLALVDSLRARPDVEAVSPNWVFHALKTPDDALYPLQWHYEAMNLPAAWDLEDGAGSGVTVAVVDTGAVGHPDLIDNLVGGYDFISDPDSAVDGDGRDPNAFDSEGDSYHGSHVAGTIAAQTNNGNGVAGVSWGAKIVPIRVLGVGGGTTVDILEGTAWAAGLSVEGVPNNRNPARVINLSLGGTIRAPCNANPDFEIANDLFQLLADNGVIVVAAAGNENEDASLKFPASCDGVITVGATGPQNTRAPYSNYGSFIDVMAAGGDVNQSFSVGGEEFPAGVLSTIAQQDGDELVAAYIFYQGTSMASPHIAGIVALMLAQNPNLGFNEVLARLQGAATPISSCSEGCGAGLVNAAAALGGGGGGPTPTPPAPPPPPPTEQLVTYVASFYCKLGCNDFDLERSQLIEVEITSDTVPFTISDLEPGTYLAAAWQDLNSNNLVDAGEPFGVYTGANGNSQLLVAAGESITNVIIVMQPATPTNQAASASGSAPDLSAALAKLAAKPTRLTP